MLKIDILSIFHVLTTEKRVIAIWSILELIVVSFLVLFHNKTRNIYHSKKVKLTDKLEIPVKVGEGQHGTSWWLNKKDYETIFKYNIINCNRDYNSICFASGGIITNFEKSDNIEKIYYIDENLHALLIGSSGSRKK